MNHSQGSYVSVRIAVSTLIDETTFGLKGKGKGKVRGWGLLQHYSLMAYCTLDP
jgi:hypothetical protein